MERYKTTSWYKCSKCGEVLHGSNFYLNDNKSRTSECYKCIDIEMNIIDVYREKCKKCGSKNTKRFIKIDKPEIIIVCQDCGYRKIK